MLHLKIVFLLYVFIQPDLITVFDKDATEDMAEYPLLRLLC